MHDEENLMEMEKKNTSIKHPLHCKIDRIYGSIDLILYFVDNNFSLQEEVFLFLMKL